MECYKVDVTLSMLVNAENVEHAKQKANNAMKKLDANSCFWDIYDVRNEND